MRKHCGIIAGMSNEAIKKIIGAVSFKAYADETDPKGGASGTGEEDGGAGGSSINYEDLIKKAREEEKKKQYKTIERLKTQNATLTEQHNNDLLKIAELEKKLGEAETKLTTAGKGDSEEVTTLKSEIATLKQDKADLETKVSGLEANKPVSREEVEAEVRAELEKEYEVKTYKAEKMAELKDDILVPELIGGDTKEDIDASIQVALTRSAEIRKSLGLPEKKGATQQKPDKRTPKSPANPSVSGVQDKEVSLEYLATLDVRSPEYAKVRQQLGLR